MKLTVCIIDDDLVSQFAARYCIQQYQADFEIITCGSGEEGLSICFDLLERDKGLPDIIFLDLIMDGMDGWAFLENLKNLFGEHKLPKIYILSAFVNAKDRAIAKENTLISGYVDKPLSRTYLNKIFKEEEKERSL